MAYADKERLTSLAQGIRDRLLIKDKTEAQALVLSVTYPNCIYWTSDTHNIIVGGQVYGRSNQVSADAPFAYLPANMSSPAADPQFDGNRDTIYIQPIKTGADAGKIKLWWYVNNTWVSSDTLDLVLPTEAEDITYDLTNTPDLGSGDVQSAVEALDGKVEDLRDEVFGDEWVDEFGRKADWIRDNCYSNGGTTIGHSGASTFFGYKVNGGEKFHIVDPKHGKNPMWFVYDTYINLNGAGAYSGTLPTPLLKGSATSFEPRVVDEYVDIPSNGRMIMVHVHTHSDDDIYQSGRYAHIYSDQGTPLSIADKTGYKIDTWTDDEIITSTTLAVGSVVPYWSDGTRYGGRGVRLNVKEGDKILLDTYSPALFGLIFTDENRVVKALYNNRRFDGVWTAPANGYCYIQDVLYRENYHYASAHGHLAYMAHDARKRVAKGGDWYNELAPRILRDAIPNVENYNSEASSPQFYARTNGVHHNSTASGAPLLATTFNAISKGKMQYKLAAFHVVVHHSSVARGAFTDIYLNGLTTTLKIATLNFSDIANEDIEGWVISVKHCTSDKIDGGFGVYSSISTAGMLNATFDKVFVHTSSDFAELYALAQKIANGEVEVDNFYGVKEKEVDFVKNAIGLQSISDLGYNILEHGATLPIDEEGYKYAKEIYDRYKDTPIKNYENLFKNDTKLVYLPMLHFTNDTNGNLYQIFAGCNNLICIPPMKIPATTANSKQMYSLFDACYSLKRFEFDVDEYQPKVLTATWRNCHSLEYIGALPDSITGYSTQVISGCESLERIERLPFLNATRWDLFFLCPNLRYVLITDFGRNITSWNCSYHWANWGIPNDKHPDARQSLVDSLLTFSYDRVNDPDNLGTAGTTCTITLSPNSYAQLTSSEIEQITAKGYTLTHP